MSPSYAYLRASSGPRTCPYPDPFERRELTIRASERVTVARREVRERHSVGAVNLDVHMVHFASVAVWREPLGHRVRVQECAIDALGFGTEHAVQPDGACGHFRLPLRSWSLVCGV